MNLIVFSGQRNCVNMQYAALSGAMVLVQPRKTRPCLTERFLMGCKESNQPNKNQTKQNFVRPDLRFNIFDTLVGIS